MSANKPNPYRQGLAWSGLRICVMCAAFGVGTASADVTVFERAPSVEELQQKLLGGDSAGQKKYKTRAIVFGDAPNDSSAQPATPVTPAQAAAQPATAQTVAPQQSMQVSESAIAFPIQFRVNSAQILPESLPFLQSIAGLMQQEPGIRVLVEGHTDISGNYQRNIVLSRERAFAVINHLVDRFGIDSMRLVPVGKGPMDPLPGREPTDPKNRRVQFRIIG